ncbi:rCG47304, isoform CRA_b [Rattus norvegicus]|uniref:RCG47304, isoform CRA_b n=2 Tax=Rattus norvegicus TaxID=10116 RepID=A6HZQ8_RAT|nr:phospholipase A and acyltransferase 5 isoform X1 [Rattus norvegicus]EDM12689.1 rCG47304, isoform CRA_b [Rattus norvegicus]|eukprot:XP_006230830.1 PREDICTED: Ca(2+)-independent N-acyltransferase isoform X1 [Rattus norvegicus]
MIPGHRGPWSAPLCRRLVPAGHSGMGLSPAASGEYGIRLFRVPWPSRPKQISRTASTESSDTQPTNGQSTLPHSDSASSQALVVQFLPKLPKQDRGLEQARSLRQGQKPEINLELIPSKKRTEMIPSSDSEIEGNLKNQAAESNQKPRPGDLIEIFRIGYEHWAIYVEDDCVVHLAPPSEFEAGSITSIFSNRAVVKYSRLQDVLHGCSWKINNKLDGTYLPLPVDKIIQRTKNMINKIVQYSLIEGNCEHFVNDLRYGVPRSQQVEHVLVEGAKAAGAVLSAVVDSIRPKPITA